MNIKLNDAYFAKPDTRILGYMGEHRARTITFEGLAVEGADRYKLRIEYKDFVSYEIDITEGSYLIDGSILRSIQTVKCQIYAVKSTEDGYELVKKSQIFYLDIRPSLKGEPVPIPTYEAAQEYLDQILDLIESGGMKYPEYGGSYSVGSSLTDDITLPTAQRSLEDNITVNKLPTYEVDNLSGGKTYIIGGN